MARDPLGEEIQKCSGPESTHHKTGRVIAAPLAGLTQNPLHYHIRDLFFQRVPSHAAIPGGRAFNAQLQTSPISLSRLPLRVRFPLTGQRKVSPDPPIFDPPKNNFFISI